MLPPVGLLIAAVRAFAGSMVSRTAAALEAHFTLLRGGLEGSSGAVP